MRIRIVVTLACCCLALAPIAARAESIAIEGAPVDEGYNVGSVANLRATLTGAGGDAQRYAVFADIQYAGTTSVASVEMNAEAGGRPDAPDTIVYETGWPIPADAPTGLYELAFRVEDRSSRKIVATEKAPGFFAYKKVIKILRFDLDKTFYAPGERIRCEVAIQNLTGQDLKGLRIEFSNENYPWISTFSGAKNLSGSTPANPALGLVVLRPSLDLAASSEATLPMEPAGTAAFLQGTQVAVMGAGGPARNFKVPPPEVDRYTLAVWNHDRTELYDMQFSTQVIVRQPGRVLPKPYSRNYTHPYNDEIDYKNYREFYPPGMISPAIRVGHEHTLYRPGDQLTLRVSTSNPGREPSVALGVRITGPSAGTLHAPSVLQRTETLPAGSGANYGGWAIPADAAPGVYHIALSMPGGSGEAEARASTEFAVNRLPSSLLVFCPHEDDEHPWTGLMRAMVEAGLPVHVVFYTGGDVGECERYFDGHPCDPVRAREFGTVRMEESTEMLEHIGVKPDQVMFLGLPDGGSGEIWFRHISVANPFLDIYLAVNHTPYENVYKRNLSFARDAVVDTVKEIITRFHPAMIAVPHPDERHVDHRTANWFTLKAAQELFKANAIDPKTVVLADQSYGSGGYKPAPYHYEKYIVYLSGEAATLKQEASWIYQSQDGNLAEGAKRTFTELPREEVHYRITDWQEHEGWNE